MYIQTEETPNPNAIKFFPGFIVNSKEPLHFDSSDDAAEVSVLVHKLFDIEDVKAVFLGHDFITITKSDNADWLLLKTFILTTIMDHYSAGGTTFENQYESEMGVDLSKYSGIEREIVEIIETRVRPSVAMDGGDIKYIGLKEGVVILELRGACSGCPSSSITLKSGIESMLKHYCPEVIAVEAFDET